MYFPPACVCVLVSVGGSGRLAWHIIQAHPHVYVTVFDTPKIIASINHPFCINQNLRFIAGRFTVPASLRVLCVCRSVVANKMFRPDMTVVVA